MSYVKATEAVQSFNGSFPLPRDRYLIQMSEEDFGISKGSGQPMVTRNWEIVGIALQGADIADTIQVEGKTVNLAGIKLKAQYLPLSNENAGKAAKAVGRFLEEQKKLGLDSEGVDTQNPFSITNTEGKGFYAWATCSCEKDVATKEPSADQVAAGGKYAKGDEIKDADGKSIIRYNPKIDQILQLADKPVAI